MFYFSYKQYTYLHSLLPNLSNGLSMSVGLFLSVSIGLCFSVSIGLCLSVCLSFFLFFMKILSFHFIHEFHQNKFNGLNVIFFI